MLALAWISTARLTTENYHAYNCLISVPSTLSFRFHRRLRFRHDRTLALPYTRARVILLRSWNIARAWIIHLSPESATAAAKSNPTPFPINYIHVAIVTISFDSRAGNEPYGSPLPRSTYIHRFPFSYHFLPNPNTLLRSSFLSSFLFFPFADTVLSRR